mmetsp:Transcript_5909/g.9058  ORF Transcript_5909/g.9058 Transcript_5909/m.9058 type:complete len:1660 (+) Transcript_5909:3576-8555(+)
MQEKIQEWKNNGEQLIIGGDWNVPADSKFMQQFCTTANLKNAYNQVHNDNKSITSRYPGSKNIDFILITAGIEIGKAGYTPQAGGASEDHRAMWIEVSFKSAMGIRIPKVIHPIINRINCQDPGEVNEFNRRYAENLIYSQVPQLLGNLLSTMKVGMPLTKEQQFLYEMIDDKKVQAASSARKKSKKRFMSGVPFSADIVPYWRAIECWKLADRRHNQKNQKKGRIKSKFWKRTLKNAGVSNKDKRLFSHASCKEELSRAWRMYNREKLKSKHHRSTHLDRLADRRAKANNTRASSEIKSLRLQEESRTQHRIIKFILQKNQNNTLSFVTTTSKEGKITEYHQKAEIEEQLCRANQRKYQLAYDTPILQEPLRTELGLDGLTSNAKNITEGKYTPTTSNCYEKAWFQHMEKSEIAKADKSQVQPMTLQEYREGWKKAKEKTSSNTYGPGYSEYKAASRDEALATVELLLLNIPFQTGYSPKRWQKALDVMLPKKKNCFEVSKLRTIGLQEADFNFFCKYLGRWAMKKAEDYGHLAKEQYGSRRRHTAIKQALNKRLTMDMAMLQRVSTVFCSQDAMSCYDRISHAALALGLRRQNIPDTAIEALITTIQNMVHKVRTTFGESALTYNGDLPLRPNQGIPQGNGMGPPGWSVISSPCLELLRSNGFGARFSTPITKKLVVFVGYCYVDDTDQVEMEKYEGEEVDKILQRMQQAIDVWETSITLTGGAIRPEKCHWYILDFQWKGSEYSLTTKEDIPYELTVKDMDGKRQIIQRKEYDESEVTLGIHGSPTGDMKHQVQRMKRQSKDWADKITAGHMDRVNVAIALKTTVWRTLGYPLAATLLTKAECEDIMKPTINAALSKMGMNRHFPRDVVFGATEYQGLGIPHLYTVQSITHIQNIVNHQLNPDLTTALHKATFESLYLLLGLGHDFLTTKLPGVEEHFPNTIATNVRNFCIQNLITLQHNIEVPLLRKKDSFLMCHLTTNNVTKYEQYIANKCRLYLKILTISDMTTGDGSQVLQSIWEGKRQDLCLRGYKWPSQGAPTESEWKVWRQVLAKTICDTRRRLHQPLLQWIKVPERMWWYDPHTECLYFGKINDRSQRWIPHKRRARGGNRLYETSHQIDKIPPTCEPTICINHLSRVYFTGSATLEDTTITEQKCDTVNQRLGNLPNSLQWPLQNSFGWENYEQLKAVGQQGRLIGVTDGSYKNDRGAAHWILCDENNITIRIEGSLLSPGESSQQQSTRAELSGIYGLASIATLMAEDGVPITITIGCDSQEAIRKLDKDYTLDATTPDYDIAHSTRQLIVKTHWEWQFKHVYGHQDQDTPCDQLDTWAQLNVECDNKAGLYRTEAEVKKLNARHLPLYKPPWRILINSVNITHNSFDKIYSHAHKMSMYKYWRRHKINPGNALDEVNWCALGIAAKRSTQTRHQWQVKQATDWLPHNVNKHKWNMVQTNECAACKEAETMHHIHTCRAPMVVDHRSKTTASLRAKMKQLKTSPSIISAILSGIKSIWQESPIATSPLCVPGIDDAIESQSKIGWWALICGRWSIYWEQAQQQYLTAICSPKSSKRWQASLITLFWNTSWDLWNFRNGVDHNPNNIITNEQQDNLINQIKIQWSLGAPAEFEKIYYAEPLSKVLSLPISSQQVWLNRIKSARSAFQ